MKKQYETVCREAGLPTEMTRKISRFYDADYHRLQYQKKQRHDYESHDVSLSAIFVSDNNSEQEYDLVDQSIDIEQEILHREDLERLSSILAKLPASDRELLLTVYSGKTNNRCEIAAQKGVSTRTLQRYIHKLFTQVKKEFLADEPDDDSFAKAGDHHD